MDQVFTTIYALSIRQITGIWRMLIMFGLLALTEGLTIWITVIDDATGIVELIIPSTIMPLICLIIATPLFSDEIEERTLANLTLAPIPRWKIVFPKIMAAVSVGGVPLAVTTFAATITALSGNGLNISGGSILTALSASITILIGVICYSSLFAFAGTLTTRAVIIGLVYIFAWESALAALLPGLRYLSISKFNISIMRWIEDPNLFQSATLEVPGHIYALIASIAVVAITVPLSIWRLRNMDVQ